MKSTTIEHAGKRAREAAALRRLQHQLGDVRLLAEAARRIARGSPAEQAFDLIGTPHGWRAAV